LGRLRRLPRSWLGIAVLVVLAAGAGVAVAELVHGGGKSKPQTAAAPTGRGQAVSRQRSFLALVIPSPAKHLPGTDVPNRIARRARSLPLSTKVAQMMVVGFSGTAPGAGASAVRGLDAGGIVLDSGNFQSPAQLAGLVRSIRLAARRAHDDPPFLMAQQLGGEFRAFPSLPPPDAPADLGSVSLATSETQDAAKALDRAGLNGVIAPGLDVAPPDAPAVGGQAFSSDPDQVSAYATATIRQWRRAGFLSVPGHFPGLGSANQPTDQGPAAVRSSMGQVAAVDLAPFRAAIRTGAPAVLLSLAGYEPDDFVTPGALSRSIVTGLLRGRLGFHGIAMTDDLSSGAITALMPVPQAAVQAVQAGADMVWISGPASLQRQAYSAILAAVRAKKIPESRIDEAVIRILAVKGGLGLASRPLPRVPKPVLPGVAPGGLVSPSG
jgi:beta-N-acetylhexosaminidase